MSSKFYKSSNNNDKEKLSGKKRYEVQKYAIQLWKRIKEGKNASDCKRDWMLRETVSKWS